MSAYEKLMGFKNLPAWEDFAGLSASATEELQSAVRAKLHQMFGDTLPFRVVHGKGADVNMFFHLPSGVFVEEEVEGTHRIHITAKKFLVRLNELPPIERLSAFLSSLMIALVGPFGSILFERHKWELNVEYDWESRSVKCFLLGRYGFENPEMVSQMIAPSLMHPRELKTENEEANWNAE